MRPCFFPRNVLYCKGKIRTRLFRRGKTRFAGIRASRTPRLFRLPLLFAKIFSKENILARLRYDLRRLAVHRLCNTRVLPHPLRGKSSQNLAAKGAKQSKAVYFAVRRGERRSACRVARASLSTMHHRKIDAFDRVRITPLQYTMSEMGLVFRPFRKNVMRTKHASFPAHVPLFERACGASSSLLGAKCTQKMYKSYAEGEKFASNACQTARKKV